jgi:hypothetical protein
VKVPKSQAVPIPRSPAPGQGQSDDVVETALDGLYGGIRIAAVDQSALSQCNRSGTIWVKATALIGVLNRFGDPALVRGTAQLNCP